MKKVKYTVKTRQAKIDSEALEGNYLVQDHIDINGNRSLFFKKFIVAEYIDQHIRPERNRLLTKSDIRMLSDNYEKLNDKEKTALKNYRQALRNLPETLRDISNPNKVAMPVSPE